MRPCVPVLTLLVLTHAAPGWTMPPEQAAAWQDDLRVMAREMERTHKDLFHAISREEFAAKVAALEARIPSLERHEVIVEMARIVAAVGDGHTNIYPTRDPRIGFHTLPVAFTFFGDGLFVRAVSESNRALLGARVLRIGDRDVGEAYEAVRRAANPDAMLIEFAQSTYEAAAESAGWDRHALEYAALRGSQIIQKS